APRGDWEMLFSSYRRLLRTLESPTMRTLPLTCRFARLLGLEKCVTRDNRGRARAGRPRRQSSSRPRLETLECRTLLTGVPFSGQLVISTAGNDPRAVAVGDLNGDGNLDIISASSADNKIAWYANDGSSGFGPEQVISTSVRGAYAVTVGDLNGDGHL